MGSGCTSIPGAIRTAIFIARRRCRRVGSGCTGASMFIRTGSISGYRAICTICPSTQRNATATTTGRADIRRIPALTMSLAGCRRFMRKSISTTSKRPTTASRSTGASTCIGGARIATTGTSMVATTRTKARFFPTWIRQSLTCTPGRAAVPGSAGVSVRAHPAARSCRWLPPTTSSRGGMGLTSTAGMRSTGRHPPSGAATPTTRRAPAR